MPLSSKFNLVNAILICYCRSEMFNFTHLRRPYYTPNSMEMSPSREAASCAAAQEFPNILWNPQVHQRVRNIPPLAPILSQGNPVHTTPSHFSTIHLNIVLPPPSVFLVLSFLLAFPRKPYTYSSSLPSVLRALPISSSLT
jgi:hypothetical protein